MKRLKAEDHGALALGILLLLILLVYLLKGGG